MKELLDVIHRNGELFASGKPSEPMVGIAMTYDIRLFFDSLLKFGDAGKSFWGKNLEGWYKLFWNWGVQTDFVDLAHFKGAEEKAPVIVLPGAVSISEAQYPELQKAIREAVEPLRDRCVCKSDRVHLACMESKGHRMILRPTVTAFLYTVKQKIIDKR